MLLFFLIYLKALIIRGFAANGLGTPINIEKFAANQQYKGSGIENI